jgi:hypothetical protein
MEDDRLTDAELRISTEYARWVLDVKVRALAVMAARQDFRVHAQRIAQQIADLEIPKNGIE